MQYDLGPAPVPGEPANLVLETSRQRRLPIGVVIGVSEGSNTADLNSTCLSTTIVTPIERDVADKTYVCGSTRVLNSVSEGGRDGFAHKGDTSGFLSCGFNSEFVEDSAEG